jgi:hypothetical protein
MPKVDDTEVRRRLSHAGLELLSQWRGWEQHIRVQSRSCRHTWSARLGNLVSRTGARWGCPTCGRESMRQKRRLQPKDIEARLRRVGVVALSPYRDMATAIRVRGVKCGHEWRARPSNLVHGGWGCPTCGLRGRKLKMQLNSEVVADRFHLAGLDLLGAYKNNATKVKVRCRKCSYVWRPYPANVFQGVGCPRCHCHGGKTEAEVRCTIERVTGWRFPKARPSWLRGRIGQLELDGYNPRHQVAFEYQGEQHYLPLYGEAALAALRRRDLRKRVACSRHAVTLICVPYWKSDIERFIREKLS